jgi:hypothetical protein
MRWNRGQTFVTDIAASSPSIGDIRNESNEKPQQLAEIKSKDGAG